ncbi:AAA family ATPase [Paeniglutamicibacter sp. NPDC012692]|uniref:ATP-binding protein n=1 Tax=Paeniglutamicibacter sp. NPDC012692 TaxID=3364388 RepID=UPI00368DD35D
MSKIISLTTTNFKRARHAQIIPDPSGNLVIVAGKNGQGKSSILDSITAALGGVNAKTTPRPIRDGEDRAEIVLQTEDLIVTRTFTPSGSRLTVKSTDGATFSKGQAKLDELIGKLSLDPLAFTQLSDRAQLEALLELVELSFSPDALEAERKSVFDRRSEVNRRVKELAGQMAGIPAFPADLPADEVSVSDLLDQYRAGSDLIRDHESAENEVARIAEKIRGLRTQEASIQAQIAEAIDDSIVAGDRVAALQAAPRPDLTGLQERIDNAEATNRMVRDFKAARVVASNHKAASDESAGLTAELETIAQTKAEGLAAAKFPVDGLGFDEDGVTYQGVPFKQASSAEQIRVSLAMAIALNPGLRVIRIADGSLLDSDSLELIRDQAAAHDFQIWIEMVGSRDDAYVIEDGEVAA